MSKISEPAEDPQRDPEVWRRETPLLVEALAAASNSTPEDVCEHLEHTFLESRTTDIGAVLVFLDEYVMAGD
jgi:hypothetical protein